MPSRYRVPLLLLLAVAAGTFYYLHEPRLETTSQVALVDRPVDRPAVDEFGLPEAFARSEHVVRRGETFSDILGAGGIDAGIVPELVAAADTNLDVRRIRPGERFYIYRNDSAASHLVYRPDLLNYVVLGLNAPYDVRLGKKPIETRRRALHTRINGSLYAALVKRGGHPALVEQIADEIYAWTIDMHHLQKGDEIRVIFEEKFVDGEFYELGNVVAARLDHFHNPFYAFRFEQDGFPEYFDDQGNSLRKVLLKSPLRYTAMTSGYTKRRFHPVQKRYKAHLGTDYAAPRGTPIWSTGDGVVLEAGFKRANGNYVKIRHNGTYTTAYLHMSRIEKGIQPRVRVRQGQVIGYVGSTGLATGPHVCYRFWKNGTQVDSRKEVMPPSAPVKATYRQAFDQARRTLAPELDNLGRKPQIAQKAMDEEERRL